MSFVTIRTVQVTLYLRAYTNMLLYFPQSVPDLGEMWCHISVYDAPRRLLVRKNRPRVGRNFLAELPVTLQS